MESDAQFLLCPEDPANTTPGGAGGVSEAWKNDQSVIADGQRGGIQSASPPPILHS